MHSISYDAIHDEFMVTQPFSQAVLVFRGDSSGEVAPIRTIQGPLTRLENPDKADVDPVNNEIIVPDGDKILVYPRTGERECGADPGDRRPRHDARGGGGGGR